MSIGTIIMAMIWIVCAILWSLMLGMEITKRNPNKLLVISDSALIILFCIDVLIQLLKVAI